MNDNIAKAKALGTLAGITIRIAAKIIALVSLVIIAHYCAVDAPRMHKCGTCGARVVETWSVQGRSGQLVEVCGKCYDLFCDE